MADLGAFFSAQTEEEKKTIADGVANASSEGRAGKVMFPGTYVMKVNEFTWTDKQTHETRKSPDVKITRKGALILDISLEVCDNGTPQVPKGSSIYHSITLLPTKGSDEKKFANTAKFMKPAMAALLGHDKISITEEWLKENCQIEFVNKVGKITITKSHKLIKEVYVKVDIVPDQNSRPKLKVVQLMKLMPGDKSFTRTLTEEEIEQKIVGDDDSQSDPSEISPSEEADAGSTTKSSGHMDISNVTKTEEDF